MNAARSSWSIDSSTSISVTRCSAARSSESSTASRSSSTKLRVAVEERDAAGEHLRRHDGRAVGLADRGHDDEDAVRGEHPAVAQRHVGDVADVDAVDEDHAALHLLAEAGALRVDLERPAVLGAEDVLRRDPDGLGELAVQHQPLVVAVDGHDVARPREVEHQLDLLLEAVARGVDRGVARRHHVGADVVEPVDRLVDRALVARDRRRGEDDRVALAQLDLRVVAVGHPPQRGERLALGARGDDDDLLRRVVVDLAQRHEHALGHGDVAQRAPDVDVLAHRAPDERHLAVERRRRVDDLLDAVDVRGEAGDHDPPLAALEDALEVGADHRLARGEAGAVGVRGVAAQQQQALAAELGQAGDVRRRAADRRLVELVVAGEEDRPEVGGDGHAARVGDRVREVDHLDLERAVLDDVARREHVQPRLAQLVLVELGARHGDRELAAVGHGDARLPQLAQQPRQAAEVVLVAVRDDDGLDVLDPRAQVREVGQHEVDAELLRGREAQPGVDQHDPALVLDDRHVLADLAHASQREDAQGAAHAACTGESSSWRASRARIAAASASSASTIGRRSVPASWPSMFSAVLTGVGLAVMNIVS